MNLRLLMTFSLSALIWHPLSAQNFIFERQIEAIEILDLNGLPYELPLLGGLNTPIQQFVDIDDDGDLDLFVQERDGFNQLIYFENEGSALQYDLAWVTDGYEGLETGNWFKFADVDDDGDFDLFAENPFGRIRYFRNVGNAATAEFEVTADLLLDVDGETIQLGGFSVPEWVDIDCDGELELFFGDETTGRISVYEYSGLDGDGAPQYEFVTNNYQDLSIVTGGCVAASTSGDGELHGANSMTFVDLNSDEDLDLIWGDFFAPSLIYLENTGTCEEAVLEVTAEAYPPGEPIFTGGFNVPRFADIDDDGDVDMFIGVLGGACSLNKDKAENFYFYENTGTAGDPSFLLRTTTFVSSIDVGEFSVVTVHDIDSDGDLDLIVANEEDIDAPAQLNSRLYLFENQGSAIFPEFRLVDAHLLGEDVYLEVNYAPTFADIDDDGDDDLILGKWDGKLTLFRNTGSATDYEFELEETNFGEIDVGNNSAPSFVDIDNDDDLDLIIGEKSGNLNFYRNTGTAAQYEYELVTTDYFEIDTDAFSFPHFRDIDDDGDQDLFIGTDTIGVLLYRNNGSPAAADYQLDGSFELPLTRYLTPNLVDIDDDGDLDLFSGVSGGGIIFYRNLEIATGIDSPDGPAVHLPSSIDLLRNYPNPFNPATTIEFSARLAGATASAPSTLRIYDVLGQVVRNWELRSTGGVLKGSIEWDGTGSEGGVAPSGIYFFELRLADGTAATGKMLLSR